MGLRTLFTCANGCNRHRDNPKVLAFKLLSSRSKAIRHLTFVHTFWVIDMKIYVKNQTTDRDGCNSLRLRPPHYQDSFLNMRYCTPNSLRLRIASSSTLSQILHAQVLSTLATRRRLACPATWYSAIAVSRPEISCSCFNSLETHRKDFILFFASNQNPVTTQEI